LTDYRADVKINKGIDQAAGGEVLPKLMPYVAQGSTSLNGPMGITIRLRYVSVAGAKSTQYTHSSVLAFLNRLKSVTFSTHNFLIPQIDYSPR
jgi:hypothetical protein